MDERRKYTKEESANPIERRRCRRLHLCGAIHAYVLRNLKPDGVLPQPLYWRRDGMFSECWEEKITSPGGVIVARALDLIYDRSHGVRQLVFGVDVTENKLPHGAAVIIGLYEGKTWEHGPRWNVGVIHYRWEPRIVSAIDWHHQASINYMHGLIMTYERYRARGRRPGETDQLRGSNAAFVIK